VPIEGRSLGQIAWRRLRRDRVAMAGGGGDRAALLSAEVDPGAVRATRKNLPFPSRFGRITKMQHFATTSSPGATHV
jgi:hypothetical protein